MKNLMGIFLFAAVTAFTLPASAQMPAVVTSDKAGWHKLGELSVSFQTERDEILVVGKDKFKSLRILVKYQAVYIASMVVYYENGDTEDIAVNSEMQAGKESQVFNLKGGSREIKKITFVYKTASNASDEKAHVEVYGLK